MDWRVYLVNNCPIVEKTKFLIVFEFPDGVRGFLINSKHHDLLKKNHNKVCVVSILAETNLFLEYDSFVDCSKMIPLEVNHLYSLQGEVCEETRSKIIRSVLACPVLENKLKIHLTQEHSKYLPN